MCHAERTALEEAESRGFGTNYFSSAPNEIRGGLGNHSGNPENLQMSRPLVRVRGVQGPGEVTDRRTEPRLKDRHDTCPCRSFIHPSCDHPSSIRHDPALGAEPGDGTPPGDGNLTSTRSAATQAPSANRPNFVGSSDSLQRATRPASRKLLQRTLLRRVGRREDDKAKPSDLQVPPGLPVWPRRQQ